MPFARVSAALAALLTFAAALGSLTSGLNDLWCLVAVVVVGLSLGLAPAILGAKFPPVAALALIYAIGIASAWWILQAPNAVTKINSVLMFPVLSCYLGWFFPKLVARFTAAAMFVASTAAVIISGPSVVITSVAQLAAASVLLLETTRRLRKRLDRQLSRDYLTGAANRAALMRALATELERHRRTGTPLAVAMIDLDKFKAINDRFGHAAGDGTLQRVVTELQGSLGRKDLVARIGGDEFVVLLPGCTRDRAEDTLARISAQSSTAWTFGVTEAGAFDRSRTVMDRADQDLYAKKATARGAPRGSGA